MRVIGGKYRSRRLKSVPGLSVRPTPDRLRETLFNVLAPEIEDTVFLDAYAGSGAVGIEALSRGSRHIILIERNAAALAVIRENLESLKIAAEATVYRGNALTLLPKYRADIVFLDPPYEKKTEYESALGVLGRDPPNLVIAQHDSHLVLAEEYEMLKRTRVMRQGSNALSFFRRSNEEASKVAEAS
jgi:16S rRNA (guanine966-N2)-methyltransferase